jgi:hypothetical protein
MPISWPQKCIALCPGWMPSFVCISAARQKPGVRVSDRSGICAGHWIECGGLHAGGRCLRPLSYAQPDRLVVLLHDGVFPVSPADYLDYQRQSTAFDVMGAAEAWGANLSGGGRPEAVPGLRVTASLFRVLGVSPLLGRTFNGDEERSGAAPVLVLSYQLWQTRFGGSKDIVGRKVQLDGTPFTVVGVMPKSFHFAPFWATQAGMWSPLPLDRPEDI